jgi:hypothetical protein
MPMRVEATFDPADPADLSPHAPAVGERHTFARYRVAEEGPYAGQWTWTHVRSDGTGGTWVPECDLKDIKEVSK